MNSATRSGTDIVINKARTATLKSPVVSPTRSTPSQLASTDPTSAAAASAVNATADPTRPAVAVRLCPFIPSPPGNGLHLGPFEVRAYGVIIALGVGDPRRRRRRSQLSRTDQGQDDHQHSSVSEPPGICRNRAAPASPARATSRRGASSVSSPTAESTASRLPASAAGWENHGRDAVPPSGEGDRAPRARAGSLTGCYPAAPAPPGGPRSVRHRRPCRRDRISTVS